MRILVDADACPVRHIITKVARQRGVPVLFVTDTSHELRDDYAEVLLVGQGHDAVDYALINRAQAGDVVVTQDYGVAAMALAKKALALNQNGLRYTDDNIDQLLAERHQSARARRAGARFGGFKKRTKEQDEAFEQALLGLLSNLSCE